MILEVCGGDCESTTATLFSNIFNCKAAAYVYPSSATTAPIAETQNRRGRGKRSRTGLVLKILTLLRIPYKRGAGRGEYQLDQDKWENVLKCIYFYRSDFKEILQEGSFFDVEV